MKAIVQEAYGSPDVLGFSRPAKSHRSSTDGIRWVRSLTRSGIRGKDRPKETVIDV
jgi:hypothetical protein